jgi:hypothetical protein
VKRTGRLLALVVAPTACLTVGLLAVPFLVLAAGGIGDGDERCDLSGREATGPAPTILGSPAMTLAEIEQWWRTAAADPAPRLDGGVEVGDLAALYLAEGSAEDVRGDLAFAQAVLETSYFTSNDIGYNNFAGIGHHDGRATGSRFPDPASGVRAHVQLLKRYAVGNDAALAHPNVAPDAGARATTWAELTGTWASDPNYWDEISRIYDAMLAADGSGGGDAGQTASGCRTTDRAALTISAPTSADGTLPLATVDGITVHQTLAAPLRALLDAAQRDGLHLAGWGYRSHERQVELRREHCGPSDYAIYEMPSSQCSPPTARPGSSMHEQGLAIDFTCNGESVRSHSDQCFQWLDLNAARFGLYNLPSEPWHWSSSGT